MKVLHSRLHRGLAIGLAAALVALVTLACLRDGPRIDPTPAAVAPPGEALSTADRIRQELGPIDEQGELAWVERVRDWVYAHTDVAADPSALLDPAGSLTAGRDVDRNFAAMANHEGGHWCAGVAYLLMQAYQALGYPSWVIHVGDPASLTHSTTLVQVQGQIYIQDAYFNLSYVDEQGSPLPLPALLRRLHDGRVAQTHEGPSRYRTVEYSDPQADLGQSWALREADRATIRQLASGRFACLSHTSYEDCVQTFEAQAFLTPGAYAFLERHALPRNLQFLLLFPVGVQEPEGFTTDPSRSPILRQMLAGAATRCSPRISASNEPTSPR